MKASPETALARFASFCPAIPALFALACCFPLGSPLLGQQPAAVADPNERNDNAGSPDRENKDLEKRSYDVRAYLRCPLGLLVEQDGKQVPIPDTSPDDDFLGPATALGQLIETLLVGYTWEPGVNHFAPRAGVLEVTNTQTAHQDVERILAALAAMPALNPRGGGIGLDPDRCVHICTTSLGDDMETVESVLYDVSDVVQTMSFVQLQTFIESIDRQTWADAGGPGQVFRFDAARALGIVQIPAVHEKIKAGLARARGIQRKPPQPAKKATRTRPKQRE